jgi:hypothetical protein
VVLSEYIGYCYTYIIRGTLSTAAKAGVSGIFAGVLGVSGVQLISRVTANIKLRNNQTSFS